MKIQNNIQTKKRTQAAPCKTPVSSYETLQKYMIDFIQEQQLKIGYRKETLRIYYFLSSLNHYIARQFTIEEMVEYLKGFCDYAKPLLGAITITHREERFCFTIPEEGTEAVHQLPLHNDFLPRLLHTVSQHGCTMNDVLAVFQDTPYTLSVQQLTGEDFDCLIYFQDDPFDNYRYCFKQEGEHLTYHRFTPEDYRDL